MNAQLAPLAGQRRLPRRPRSRRVLRGAVAFVATVGLGATACASGRSIGESGNVQRATTVGTTAAAGTTGDTTVPGGTIPLGGAPTTISLGGAPTTVSLGGPPTTISLAPPGDDGFAGRGFGPATQASPGAPDFAPCPVDALDQPDETADGPVHITFWHAMTNVLDDTLIALTEQYNQSQDRVVVELQNQTGYTEAINTYTLSSQADRPELVQMPEYMVQQMADDNSVVPIGACIQTEGYDFDALLPRALFAYQTGGVQWSMPFNVSGPVLYYNRQVFEAAGLDPDRPPITLEEMREYAEAIVESGAATYGWSLDTGIDSGGGWFLEQWFARLGLAYADNSDGRAGRATEVLWDTPEAVEMLTFVQEMVDEGLAFNVGDNASGQDVLLKVADETAPAAMGITTSAGIGTVLDLLDAGFIEGITADDLGIGPMPGPTDTPSAIVGGASLYIVREKGDAETAAAWDYIKYLVSAESQAVWSAFTGYVPMNTDAVELEVLESIYAEDPRFRVAYDQLLAGDDDLSGVGPVIGPLRELRAITAGMMASIYAGVDVETAIAAAVEEANAVLAAYNARQ